MRQTGPYQPRSVDALFRGDLVSGLVPSQAADTDHDTTISIGAVRQETAGQNFSISSTLTKQIDAAWAEGDNQGGLDGTESVPGTPDANTWYFKWLIHNTSTAANDWLYSESASSPTLPSSAWVWKKRLGAVLTDGSANITPYTASEIAGGGIRYVWDLPVLDVSDTNPGTSAVPSVMTVPLGIVTEVRFAGQLFTSGITVNCIITETVQTDSTPTIALRDLTVTSDVVSASHESTRLVDTSAQIRYHLDASNAGTVVKFHTIGWTDHRRD